MLEININDQAKEVLNDMNLEDDIIVVYFCGG